VGKKQAVPMKIEFSGRLTVHTAQEQKQRLLEAAAADGPLTVVWGDITHIDLSFFQLLCAFHRSMLRKKRLVDVELPVGSKFREIMAVIGYRRRAGCTEAGEESCFWKKITEGTPGNGAPSSV
jgi:hypothetical protein